MPLLRETNFRIPLDELEGNTSARLMTQDADGRILASEFFPLACGVCVVLVVTADGIHLEAVS